MREGKDNTLLLTVIGIATLLVAVAGATFAYFTAQTRYTDANESTLTIYSSQGTVNKLEGGATLKMDNIYPVDGRVWATKVITYTTTAGTTGADQGYTVTLNYVNSFADNSIAYNFEAVESTDTAICKTGWKYDAPCDEAVEKITSNALTGTESFVTGGTGTFEKTEGTTEKTITFTGGNIPITVAAKHVYKLEISYPNGAGNQNADQGKSISVRVTVAEAR